MRLEHRLHQYCVQQKVAVTKHDSLGHARGTGSEYDGRKVRIDDLSVDVAAVSVPDHVTALLAEFLPRNESGLCIFVLVHIGVDDVAQHRTAAGLDVLEALVVFVVDGDDRFDLALDGQLSQLALIELSVQRDHDSDASDYREVGFAPLYGVASDESDVPVLQPEFHKSRAQRVDVLADLTEADLSERLLRVVFLHEERKIRPLIGAVVQHVLEIGDYVLVLEEVALVLRLLELVKHLADDLALAPLDISVF